MRYCCGAVCAGDSSLRDACYADHHMALGPHKIEFEALEGWGRLPDESYAYVEVAGVACDSRDRVYVFNRGAYPVVIFDKDGKFLNAWGKGVFKNPHGIFIDGKDNLWLADDKDHTVHKFTADGERLMTIGQSGKPSDTGYGINKSPVIRAAGPFHRVTNVAVLKNGDMYIADGYGNARVHKFSKDGKLLFSWGEPGSGPGQFHLPHGIAVDAEGKVYVCDREADRIQIFSPEGEYLSEWTDTQRPTHLCFDAKGNAYVTELAWYEGDHNYREGEKVKKYRHARLGVYDRNGKMLARWGTPQCTDPGSFAAPHGLAIDSKNDLYVSEVTWTFAVSRGRAPDDCHTFQKFSLNA